MIGRTKTETVMPRRFARSFGAVTLQAWMLLGAGLPVAVAHAEKSAPTQEIVEKTLKGHWDKATTTVSPRSELKLNAVKFGKPYKATVQEVQVEGIPDRATVTPAIVDFTVRTYYTRETQAVRRVREARVYKDKMDEWAVMTGSVKGQDTTTKEPPQK